MTIFNKFIYFLKDERMIWNIISSYYRKVFLTNILKKIETLDKVTIMLTFDVEQDFGSFKAKIGKSNIITSNSMGSFLSNILDILKSYKIKSTFFVQASLINDSNYELFKDIQKNHEIGLHGYNHEPWGYDWFIFERVPPIKERERLLVESLKKFEEYHLKRPVSFRAPNMVIDIESLKLLSHYGFKFDSSAQSYKGVYPIVTNIIIDVDKIITEIPVSACPIPCIANKCILPYIKYNLLNLKTLKEIDNHKFINIIECIFKIQRLHNQEQHLVILSHSWEFTDYTKKYFNYCGKENYITLIHILELLEDMYDVNYTTIKEFGEKLCQNLM